MNPAVWFLAIRANSGADVFTERLVRALESRGLRAGVTWLPHWAEVLPWLLRRPSPPEWANVVHVNTWLPPQLLPPHLPVVATMHSCVHDPALEPYKGIMQALYHRLWIKRVEKGVLKRADVVTAVSGYTAARAGAAFGCSSIQVVLNGVDPSVFASDERAEAHAPFRLLYAGNWSKRKGADLIGPIMERLGSDFELLYTADRKNAQSSYHLPWNCRCVGRPSNASGMAKVYCAADVLLFPSRLEGFGLVAAEAMACGLPVVAADNTALPEVVVDGETGFLCKTDDVQGFVQSVRTLQSDPALWRKLRAGAMLRAKRDLTEDSQVEKYLSLYRSLIQA